MRVWLVPFVCAADYRAAMGVLAGSAGFADFAATPVASFAAWTGHTAWFAWTSRSTWFGACLLVWTDRLAPVEIYRLAWIGCFVGPACRAMPDRSARVSHIAAGHRIHAVHGHSSPD